MHFPRASAVPRVPVYALAPGDVRFAARASPQDGCLFVHQLMRLYPIVCTVGEISGRLFPLTEQEQPHKHSAPQVKRVTVLQAA